MPLQIRRGTTAQRLSIVPLPGEPIYDTDLNLIYVGDGVTAGGTALTGISLEDAQDAMAQMLVNGQHQGVQFIYGVDQDLNNRIDATLDLAGYDGEISASGFRGSLFADDSGLIVDSSNKNISANNITATTLSVDTLNLTNFAVADFKGSVFSDNSTILVNSVDSSINLDGTVKGNIIPDANEAYDIGSSSFKFKDLYLSGSSLYLGSAQITAAGSVVDLPIGSTVGGTLISTGVGTGDGVVEGSNYKINIVSDSSTIMVNSDTGQLIGTLLGNVTGDVTASTITTEFISSGDSSEITFTHIARMQSDLVVENELSVIGNINGDLVGNVTGNVNGDVTSNTITTEFLDGAASNPITVRGQLFVQSDLTVENELQVNNDLTVIGNLKVDKFIIGSTGTLRIENQTDINDRLRVINEVSDNVSTLNISKFTNSNFGARIVAERARGSVSSPVSVSQSDILSVFSSVGYDGTSFLTGAAITALVDNTVTTGRIPTSLVFSTRNASGVLADRGRFNSNGTFELFQPLYMSRTNVTTDFMILQQFTTSPNDSANLTFTRARGTVTAPVIANSNDAIIDLASAAFDGVTYTGSSTIRMNIDGAVSSGIVPGRIEFWTSDLTGAQTKKAQFNRDGILEVDQIRALNSSLNIFGDITGSVFADGSTMVIDGTDGTVKYYPTTSSDWSAPAPTTVGEALDRLATVVKALNAGTGA